MTVKRSKRSFLIPIVFLTKSFSALREHDFVSEAIFEHFQDHCGKEPDVVPGVVNPLSISV